MPAEPVTVSGLFFARDIHRPVGARLARESDVSVEIDAGCAAAFASKLRSYKARNDLIRIFPRHLHL
ncbi:hypothetical protein ACQKP7_26455 [Pseudomonas frederiksbergensis]|uniref:hypothetical protein n=1 Tax=Pseudomonas frederiksbergensis TaxID=104087 RepID=UPI003CFC21D4